MGFNIQRNKLLNDNKSIPQSFFTHNTQMGTVWLLKTISIPLSVDLVYTLVQNSKFSTNSLVVESNFNPIISGPCVHSGTKFKVLIVFFVENMQQDDSFHQFTIIKTNKTRTHFSVFSIEYIFLPQRD